MPCIFDTIQDLREMRKGRDAPVDKMICLDFDPPLSDKQKRLHELISMLLSSQTKDEITIKALARFRKQDFSAEGLNKLSEHDLQELIYPVGFYRRKAVQLKKILGILLTKYNGDIPYTINEMRELPGIGPKMAVLLRAGAWGIVEGIGVDTHVHRLAQLWKWVPETKDPEKVRKILEDLVPQDQWYELNVLIVGFGQTVCPARAPKCEQCLLNSWCRGSKVRTRPSKAPIDMGPAVKLELDD